jgi:hypothetical protein
MAAVLQCMEEYHWTTEDFIFQSVSRANTVNMNVQPQIQAHLYTDSQVIKLWSKIKVSFQSLNFFLVAYAE